MNDVDIGLTQRGGGGEVGPPTLRDAYPIPCPTQPATVIGHRSGPGPGPWKVVTLNYIMFYRERLQCIATYVCMSVCMSVCMLHLSIISMIIFPMIGGFKGLEVSKLIFVFFDMFLLNNS